MSRRDKLKPKGLKRHIQSHKVKRQLNVGWDVFCAMAEANASILSMAKTFHVEWRIMEKWLNLYKESKALDTVGKLQS